MKYLRDVLKEYVYDEITPKRLKELESFSFAWMTKSNTIIDFLSSDLVGVHEIRFTKDDEYYLYSILDIDPKDFTKAVLKAKDVNKDFKTVSNPLYILLTYIIHILKTDKRFTNTESIERAIGRILIFKMLSSSIYNFFPRPLDLDIAVTLSSSLSHKTLIKQHENWIGVIDHLVDAIVLKDGVHFKRVQDFTIEDIILILSNYKTRINSLLKIFYKHINKIIDTDGSRDRLDMYINTPDGDMLRDTKDIHRQLYNVSKTLLLDKQSFVNKDLLRIVEDVYPRTPTKLIKETIQMIPDVYHKHDKELDEVVSELIRLSIHYLYIDKMHPPYSTSKNIIKLITYLKFYYTNSKVVDPKLTEIKATLRNLVKKHVKIKTQWKIVNMTNILMIYIFVLANLRLHKAE
jgi:hypothetical protein